MTSLVAFDLDGFQFVLFDLDILALLQFVPARLLFAFDHVAGLGVDHLLFQPVAGFPVDHVEVGLLDRRGGRIERHGTRHERKLQ